MVRCQRSPNYIVGIPNGIVGISNGIVGIPNGIVGVPNDIVGVPNDIVGIPNDIVGVPNDIVGVPNGIVGVPNGLILEETALYPLFRGEIGQDLCLWVEICLKYKILKYKGVVKNYSQKLLFYFASRGVI